MKNALVIAGLFLVLVASPVLAGDRNAQFLGFFDKEGREITSNKITVVAGSEVEFSIKMKNSGGEKWNKENNFFVSRQFLAVTNPAVTNPDKGYWSSQPSTSYRTMDLTEDIWSTGTTGRTDTAEFKIRYTASTPRTTELMWQMYDEGKFNDQKYFGSKTQLFTIEVKAPSIAGIFKGYTTTPATDIKSGQEFTLNFNFENTGTLTWDVSKGKYCLDITGIPAEKRVTTGNEVCLLSNVAAGATGTLKVNVKTSESSNAVSFGNDLYLRYAPNAGSTPYDLAKTSSVQVKIDPYYDAKVISVLDVNDKAIKGMTPSDTVDLKIKVKNTGKTQWKNGFVGLFTYLPFKFGTDSRNKRPDGLSILYSEDTPLLPDSEYVFKVPILAPNQKGDYNLEFNMADTHPDGGSYFGSKHTTPIKVEGPTATLSLETDPKAIVLKAGDPLVVTVVIKNTGDTPIDSKHELANLEFAKETWKNYENIVVNTSWNLGTKGAEQKISMTIKSNNVGYRPFKWKLRFTADKNKEFGNALDYKFNVKGNELSPSPKISITPQLTSGKTQIVLTKSQFNAAKQGVTLPSVASPTSVTSAKLIEFSSQNQNLKSEIALTKAASTSDSKLVLELDLSGLTVINTQTNAETKAFENGRVKLPVGTYQGRVVLAVQGETAPREFPISVKIGEYCPDKGAEVCSPKDNEKVSGKVQIKGTASGNNKPGIGEAFQSGYSVQLIEANNKLEHEKFHYPEIVSGAGTVSKGTLGYWDTTKVPDGNYLLRVIVKNAKGQFYWPDSTKTTKVIVKNKPNIDSSCTLGATKICELVGLTPRTGTQTYEVRPTETTVSFKGVVNEVFNSRSGAKDPQSKAVLEYSYDNGKNYLEIDSVDVSPAFQNANGAYSGWLGEWNFNYIPLVQRQAARFVDTDLKEKEKYLVRLRVVSASGQYRLSQAITLVVPRPVDCTGTVSICGPQKGNLVDDAFEIIGNANTKNFAWYELAYSPSGVDNNYYTIGKDKYTLPCTNCILGKWDPTDSKQFPADIRSQSKGVFYLRLRVVDKTANYEKVEGPIFLQLPEYSENAVEFDPCKEGGPETGAVLCGFSKPTDYNEIRWGNDIVLVGTVNFGASERINYYQVEYMPLDSSAGSQRLVDAVKNDKPIPTSDLKGLRDVQNNEYEQRLATKGSLIRANLQKTFITTNVPNPATKANYLVYLKAVGIKGTVRDDAVLVTILHKK